MTRHATRAVRRIGVLRVIAAVCLAWLGVLATVAPRTARSDPPRETLPDDATSDTPPDDLQQRDEREIATKKQLINVRLQIRDISAQQLQTEAQRGGVAAELREHETAIARVAAELRTLESQLLDQQHELDQLQTRRDELNRKLEQQRNDLATLLRSAYALGQHEELKLLLQQDDVGTASRVLAYHRYFQRARIARISELLGDLQQLAQLQTAIQAQTALLQRTRVQQQGEVQTQQQARAERQALLDQLDLDLNDQQKRLRALGKDETALLGLLEKLRDIFADIPQQLSGAEPFARQRGRLAWPLRGRLAVGYGASDDNGRTISGIVVAARNGSPVQAVSHGRVAYADWLTGYGLLLIVDHGDGYMSLYGYNESLLKDVGDWVDAGQTLATVGASGGRKQPGLYFELRLKGKPLDPRGWLKPITP